MKKIFLLTILLFQLSFVFGQSETLYSEQGVTLSYSATKYNTIELQNDIYDQYEVKIRFSNNSGRYIHQPKFCRISFRKDFNHPSSNSDFDFAQSGEAYGYVEYTDGTQLPLDLDSPIEDEKYGRVTSRMIITPNNSDECTKYVLVKSGTELERPTFSVEFSNSYPVIVSGTNSLISTWVDRQAKGISLKNTKYWPMIIRTAYDGTNCGNTRPIGNKGGIQDKKVTVQDVKNALNLSAEQKFNIAKKYFLQAGYKLISENQNNSIILRESKLYDGTPDITKVDYFYMGDFSSFKLVIDKEDNSIAIITIGESEDNLLDKLLEPFETAGMGDPPGENGEPAYSLTTITK